jgi:hypothetical protein
VAGNRLDFARLRIAPDGMRAGVASAVAALGLQVSEQFAPFHPTMTVVLSAFGELWLSASWRRYSSTL